MAEQKTQYKRKGTCEPLATNDLTAILDLIVKNIEHNRGRQAAYPDTQQGIDAFCESTLNYFRYVNSINADETIEKKLVPDVESWCVYLGITRTTLMQYTRRPGVWAEMIENFKNSIAACKKQCAFAGKIPPLVTIFDLTNNHHYLNTNSFTAADNEIKEERRVVTLAELREQIALREKEGKI